MNPTSPLNPGPKTLWEALRDLQTATKNALVIHTKFSERSVRTYLQELFEANLIKEMPNYGRTKMYACIDYVPVMDESRPLAQRWQVWAPAGNQRFTLGELATHYGNGVEASSIKAANLLLKAPALLCYYAQAEMSEEDLEVQLKLLMDVLGDACDQLQSAISVFQQLRSDPRYSRPDLLQFFTTSPDFPLPKDLTQIIARLQEEMTPDDPD